jgi:hypothetical protein
MSTLDEQQSAIELARKMFLRTASKKHQAGESADAEYNTAETLYDAWKTLTDLKKLQEIKESLGL